MMSLVCSAKRNKAREETMASEKNLKLVLTELRLPSKG